MTEQTQQARRQQVMEELCGASIRGLTGQGDLHFRGHHLHQGLRRLPVHAPHLNIDVDLDSFQDLRGVTDAVGLRFLHHDRALHHRLRPDQPQQLIERLVFELLEQLRVESLVPENLVGLRRNLIARFHQWCRDFRADGLADNNLGIFIFTIAQVCWAKLNTLQVMEEMEDFIEPTRWDLAPIIGHDLAGMKREREDQAAFAVHALAIAKVISDKILEHSVDEDGNEQPPELDEDDDKGSRHKLMLDFDDSELDDALALALSGYSKTLGESDVGYRVFSRKFDREAKAHELVRVDQRLKFREQLDQKIRTQGVNVAGLARKLAKLFAQPERDGWLFGQEEGYIDGRRLSTLITSPSERRLFRWQRYQAKSSCTFTFLIDCSGSMKAYIEDIAVLIDVFGRALEQAGVTVEVLGFTTGGWNGGRVTKEWTRAGRPKQAGRLNERLHIIYKDADTSWKRARSSIAGLLRPDLFRESINGEALLWAVDRLKQQDSQRKIITVLSDGSPVDTATNRENDAFYLDNHLKETVIELEQAGEVEVYGLGVGLDLSPFYSQCLAMDLSQGLNNEVLNEILELLQGRHRR